MYVCYQRAIRSTWGNYVLICTSGKDGSQIQMARIRAFSDKSSEEMSVTIDGQHGADLVVALSSASAAVSQVHEARMKVGDLIVEVQRVSPENGSLLEIRISQGASSFVIHRDLAAVFVDTLNRLLNDITGEYVRQVGVLEAKLSEILSS